MTLFEFQKSQLVRALNDTAGALAGALLALYQGPIDINQSLTLATLDAAEATYNAYARGTLLWGDAAVSDDGIVECVATQLRFRPTDALVPNGIWGLYIVDATAAFLFFAGQFDLAPLPLNNTLQEILVNVRYRPASGTLAVEIG